jgi:hypothetical protein
MNTPDTKIKPLAEPKAQPPAFEHESGLKPIVTGVRFIRASLDKVMRGEVASNNYVDMDIPAFSATQGHISRATQVNMRASYSLVPRIAGPVVIFDPAQRLNQNNFPNFGMRVKVVTDIARLGALLGGRQYGLLIELNDQRKDPLLINRTYRTPSYFPDYVRVDTVEGLVAALSNEASWIDSFRKEEQPGFENLLLKRQIQKAAKERPIQMVRISGDILSAGGQEAVDLVRSVAEHTMARQISLDQAGGAKAGFSSGISFEQLTELVAIEGADLKVVHKNGEVLAYSLDFTEPKALPIKGREIAQALALAGETRAAAYVRVLEVTPAGLDVSRILKLDLHRALQREIFEHAREKGLEIVSAECRAFPNPNKEGFAGLFGGGAQFRGICIERTHIENGQHLPVRTGVITFDLDEVLSKHHQEDLERGRHSERHSIRAGRSSSFNVMRDSHFRLTAEERIEKVNQLLGHETKKQFHTGANDRCKEHMLFTRTPGKDEITLTHWIWDSILNTQIYHEQIVISSPSSIPSCLGDTDRFDKFLQLALEFGKEFHKDELNDVPTDELLARSLAAYGVSGLWTWQGNR